VRKNLPAAMHKKGLETRAYLGERVNNRLFAAGRAECGIGNRQKKQFIQLGCSGFEGGFEGN